MLMKRWKHFKNCINAGFTLAELLITVAIISILGAVITVSAVQMVRNMRQASSDKVAEGLYTAVTAHLQEVYAFDYNRVETLQSASTAIGVTTDPNVEKKILYITNQTGGSMDTDVQKVVFGVDGSAVGADYAGDYIIVEYNPSSLQVYSVFYSSEVSPDSYYKADGSAENSLDDLRNDVSKRKSEFNGYLGYYQANTQDLPELNDNEYGVTVGLVSPYSTDRYLRNLDELNAPVTIHIPNEELGNVGKLQFEIVVTGKESGASAKLVYDEKDISKGGVMTHNPSVLKNSSKYDDAKMVSFELVLDNLKEGTFEQHFCTTEPGKSKASTIIRFCGKNSDTDPVIVIAESTVPITLTPSDSGKLFVPGEDIEVHVLAVKVDGVEMDIAENSENSATDNSIFAYGSGKKTDPEEHYAAYLAYGRHLQNLSKEASGINSGLFETLPIEAYQVDDIDFTKEAKDYDEYQRWLWPNLYGDKDKAVVYEAQKSFQPIVNSNVKKLCGDYKLEYNAGTSSWYASTDRAVDYVGETHYTINGLIVKSTSEKTIDDAGMFAKFSGNEIRNITLSNPRISGEGITGGLIGKVALKHGETLLIENCGLYMTDEYCAYSSENPYGIEKKGVDSKPQDVTGIWMSGKTCAGGLIGQFSYDKTDTASGADPLLTIKHSHASTVIDTTDDDGKAGGLIGFVGTDGSDQAASVLLESSYADCYIYGTDTGGLIGRIDPGNPVEMKYVYSAGFQVGSIQAGFANGTIDAVRSSYAFTQMSLEKNAQAFTTAAKINTVDEKVYYFPQNNANSGNVGRIKDASNTTNVEKLATESQTTSVLDLLLNKLGSAFQKDPGSTCPYNLRKDMALSTYTKPRLKDIVHYGDWEETFMPGALVYYEKYLKSGSKVRFYGGNYNALYDSLEEGQAVQADGYGLVYRENDERPDSATVTYSFTGKDGSGNEKVVTVTEDMDLKTATPILAEYADQKYLIYPLKTENVNHVLYSQGTFDADFYTKVDVVYKKGTANNTEVYYFNPHFARAVGYLGNDPSAEVPELKENGTIYIRSARHLYNLSLYYKYYRNAITNKESLNPRDCTFQQSYDISYKDYDWNGFFSDKIPAGNCITRQNPIGLTSGDSFIAKYNGGCFKIRDVSFVLEKKKNGGAATSYTGLFGYNKGNLQNIVLFANYDESDTSAVTIGEAHTLNPDDATQIVQNHYYAASNATVHYYAGTEEDINKNNELYLGVLAGKNDGTITNCATAGYYLADANGTIVGNSNSYVYAGGLAGENTGTVTNSAADTPFVRLTTNYSTAFLAGFAGRNTGRILNSYALGHIEVVNPRGGSITLAGFSANNTGELTSCYSAVNIQSSGNSKVYGFSPKSGIVRESRYLNKGTLAYVGHLYSYTYMEDKGAGTGKTRDGLVAEAVAKAQTTVDYPKYQDNVDKDYPYQAVVTDANGRYIHYGDWQRMPVLGKYGIFYWEKEDTGGNAGYHFSFIGVDEQYEVAGTSLCNAHDDSGIIVDYGYGYYVSKGNEGTVETYRDPGNINATYGLQIPENHLSGVAEELQKEAPEYTFYPYRTLPNNATDKTGSLYLTYSAQEVADGHWKEHDDKKDIRNGQWVLKKGDATKTFYVSPYFANAMSIDPDSATKENAYAYSQDGINRTDYVKKPGTTENPYEIRTVEQLQYINWNAEKQNVSTLVDGSTYKYFPYLAYTSVLGQGKQKKADAGHNETLKFLQTHDVSGVKTDGTSVIANYTPIAASHTASSGDSYNAILYAWFGSDYDGQSYKITNINISSPAFSVGVFGVTVSAGLNNIILYSDRDNVIERRNGADMTPGGYSLGGLVGIAYQYEDVPAGTGTIQNCAVAGFKIKDESTNQLTQGESNVGGLIGATRVDVKNCSAVTDIEINCTHTLHSTWGDYVRTGGLIGALPGTATNCYTGGSIKVGDKTLAESVDTDGDVIPLGDEELNRVCDREKSMNVYIAGFAGSAFSMNYQNFTGKTGADDKSPTMINCYSFVEFPPMKGSIRAITAIASLADRYGNDGLCDGLRVNLYNCHYLNPYKGALDKKMVDVSKAAKYTIRSDNGHTSNMSPYDALNATTNFVFNDGQPANETFYENMIRGGGAYPSKVTGYRNKRIADHTSTQDIDVHPTELSYEQLSGSADGIQVWDRNTHGWETQPRGDGKILAALNYDGTGTFGWVTTTLPSGAPIDGKYSFPGNHPELDGLNYVFPTIVTQRDLVFSRTVNVHYGRWPLSGAYWSEARSEMDIFGDKEPDELYAYKTLQLINAGDVAPTAQDFTFDIPNIVAIDSITPAAAPAEAGTYDVRIKALGCNPETKNTTVTVTAKGSAKLILEVKANFSVSTNPSEITAPSASIVGVDDATKTLNFLAKAVSTPDRTTGATTDRDYASKAKWDVTVHDGNIGYLDKTSTKTTGHYDPPTANCEVTGNNPGRTQIFVNAKLKYPNNDQGVDYESSVYLPLQTYGVIGLSDNNLSSANTVFWNETSRSSTGSTGQNKDYSAAAQKPTMEDDSWTDFFLYETYADETLGSMTITGIKINGADVTEAVIDDGTKPIYTSSDDNYIIDIGSASAKLSTDGKYRYRSLKLRPKSGAGADVTVQLTVKDGETKASYVLSGSFKGTHVVTANSNEPTNTSGKAELQWKSLHADTSGTVNLYNAGIPTLVGYKFTGWSENATGPAQYCTGDNHQGYPEIRGLTSDKTLYAIWAPITYTIAFDPGAGSLITSGDNLTPIAATYDADATLYNKTQVEQKYAPPTNSTTGLMAAPPAAPTTDPESGSAGTPSLTPSGDPSTPSGDPSTPSGDPSTPSGDPSTPSGDPSTPSGDPSTPSGDPSTPSGDPSTPSADPSTPSGDPSTPSANPSTTASNDLATTYASSLARTPVASIRPVLARTTGSAPTTDPDPAPTTDPDPAPTTDPDPAAAPTTDSGADPAQDPEADPAPMLAAPLRGASANGTKFFVGWNTESDGSGFSYKPGASVRNLTETDRATITLYAQWREYYQLIFMDYKDGSVPVERRTVNMSAGGSEYQLSTSDLPTGVERRSRNGIWGYYWTSTQGATYRLVGWDVNRRKAVSEVTYPITFDTAGNPTFQKITGIDGDNTYYAIWEEQTYAITLVDCLEGTPQTTVLSNLSGSLTKLNGAAGYTIPTHDGYTFEGWYTARIATGGEEFAGADSLLKDGKKLADLLTNTDNITLYARYSTNIYEKTSDLKDNYDYLVTIKEIGNSAGAYKGKFAYLLTNNTSGYHPSGGIKDLAGVDHTFRDAATHGKFYTDEAGTAAKLLGSVEYMDTSSMPTDIHNPEREKQEHTTDPIGMIIPDNAVWTWHSTANFTGKLEMTNDPGKYLYTETGTTPHVRVGTTEGIWKYEQMTAGYNLLQSNEASGYYLHDNYWNLNLNKDNVKNEGSDPPNNRSFRITFYEKTKIYLDEAPASTP